MQRDRSAGCINHHGPNGRVGLQKRFLLFWWPGAEREFSNPIGMSRERVREDSLGIAASEIVTGCLNAANVALVRALVSWLEVRMRLGSVCIEEDANSPCLAGQRETLPKSRRTVWRLHGVTQLSKPARQSTGCGSIWWHSMHTDGVPYATRFPLRLRVAGYQSTAHTTGSQICGCTHQKARTNQFRSDLAAEQPQNFLRRLIM